MSKDPEAHSLEELERLLRQAMDRSASSIRAISRATEISKTLLADFKNGERNLSFQNLHVLANHLGVRYNLKNY